MRALTWASYQHPRASHYSHGQWGPRPHTSYHSEGSCAKRYINMTAAHSAGDDRIKEVFSPARQATAQHVNENSWCRCLPRQKPCASGSESTRWHGAPLKRWMKWKARARLNNLRYNQWVSRATTYWLRTFKIDLNKRWAMDFWREKTIDKIYCRNLVGLIRSAKYESKLVLTPQRWLIYTKHISLEPS